MVKSSSSCFKILACGTSSVDVDEFEGKESKESTDNHGWNFRKKSSRHRVLSNTVISETPSIGNKESAASTTITSVPQSNSAVPEKVSVPPCTNEKSELPAAVHSSDTDPPIAKGNGCKIDPNLEESAAVVIQAAIRGYLAQRTLLKLKNVVKLQAAVRGHLVRRQAVGTLRCVQAIVKMQALVRARRARLLVEGSVNEKTKQTVMPLGKGNSGTKPHQSNSSKKLLSNGFARQLWESAPKTKPILIKCDTSKSNSAWNWLERWMSVSPSELAHSDKPGPESQEQGENIKASATEAGPAPPAEVISMITDLNPNSRETMAAVESENSLITNQADDFDIHGDQPHIDDVGLNSQNAINLGFQDTHSSCPSIKDGRDQPQVEDVNLGKLQEASEIDLLPHQTEKKQSCVISKTALDSVSDKPELNGEQPKCNTEKVASVQLQTENKKFALESRKVSNPAFLAVKSKFEELSSLESSSKPINSINQDLGTESKMDSLPCPGDSVTKAKESSPIENSISSDPKVQVVGSEYGTKLSFSSTLDSLDMSEVEGGERDHETKVAEKGDDDVCSAAEDVHKLGTPDPEARIFSSKIPCYMAHDSSGQPGKMEDVNGESSDAVVAVDSPGVEQQPDRSMSDVQAQMDSVMDQQACKASPGSPRSHMTPPESQGTPSSQVSIKSKRDKLDRNGGSSHKRKSQTSKRSPLNQNDTGVTITEQLSKDSRSGKRHNSTGSPRSYPVEQERRDSSGSNFLPSYMQATESARARAQLAHNSPRSSPDVLDKDIKKRHSLPGPNGKQVSPRMQRSTSQEGVKGNGTHSPRDRRWQR